MYTYTRYFQTLSFTFWSHSFSIYLYINIHKSYYCISSLSMTAATRMRKLLRSLRAPALGQSCHQVSAGSMDQWMVVHHEVLSFRISDLRAYR